MLVDDVEPVEDPERIKLWPTLVELQPVKRCLESLPTHLADFVRPSRSEFLLGEVDRELGLVCRVPCCSTTRQVRWSSAERRL